MVMQTSCKKGMEQMDLLQAFEIIVDKAKGSSLGEKFYQEQTHILDLFLTSCVSPSVPVPSWHCLPTGVMTITSSFLTIRIFWIAESLACFDIPRRQRNLLTRNMSAGVRMKVFTTASPWR